MVEMRQPESGRVWAVGQGERGGRLDGRVRVGAARDSYSRHCRRCVSVPLLLLLLLLLLRSRAIWSNEHAPRAAVICVRLLQRWLSPCWCGRWQ